MDVNTMLAMKVLVIGLGVGAAGLFATGCGRGESRITNSRLMDAAGPPSSEPTAPLEVESVSLVASTDPDAHARDWIECVGGTLEWAGGKVEACKERERAWVDPDRDEVTLVVMAEGALLARAKVGSAEVEAPFVDGRARLRVKLRPAFGTLMASAVSERTRLEVELEVESQAGDAKGSVRLETPRVARLFEDAMDGAFVAAGMAAGAGERRGAIFLGPEPARLPPNPEVPVSLLERVVLDVGEPRLVLPCPDASGQSPSVLRGGRQHRPVHLKVIELATGRLVGERVLGAEPPACGEAPGAGQGVGPDQVANAVEVLVAGGPSEGPDGHLGWPVKDPARLLGLQRFLGLTRGASAAEVGLALGIDSSGRGQGPVSALVTENGLEEVRVLGQAGVDILKTKNLGVASPTPRRGPDTAAMDGEPVLRLLDQPIEVALGELGRPSHHGRDFAVWTVDQGALTIYVELRCDPDGERRCRELRVGTLEGRDPHDGGDVPGAKGNPHSHRHPNDQGHDHGHDHPHEQVDTPAGGAETRP